MTDQATAYFATARARGVAAGYNHWLGDHPDATTVEQWKAVCHIATVGHWPHVAAADQDALLAAGPPADADLTRGEHAEAEWVRAVAEHADQLTPNILWATRPILGHLHTCARARLVGPWALLGATMARVVACVPPYVRLPPVVVSWASLNLFVALVGPSGDGKNGAESLSAEVLRTPEVDAVPLGSGEGLSHMFMRLPPRRGRNLRDGAAGGDVEPEQYRTNVLVTIAEIDSFTAVSGRKGSTLGPQLRQAAMGGQLGFFYVASDRRMIVPAHVYRMCVVAGIQPKRAAALLVGAEADGGTPQRFLWLPTADPGASADLPAMPEPLAWQAPRWPAAREGIPVADAARRYIVDQRVRKVHGEIDDADAHAPLGRLKVATALALLDGRAEVAEQDWQLSRLVMRVSEATKAHCLSVVEDQAREANVGQARREAERAQVIDDIHEQGAVNRAVSAVLRKLARTGEPMTAGALRRGINTPLRPHLAGALDHLIEAGRVEVIPAASPKGEDSYQLAARSTDSDGDG